MSKRLLLLPLLVSVICPVASAQDAVGPEFRVNSYTTGMQNGSAVASDANGNFVVVWMSDGQNGSGWGLFGQRFNASGLPQGSEFPVSNLQADPAVASDANGNFVVVGDSPDGSGWGVFGQRFNASGVPQGGAFQVNTYTTDNQFGPAVASDANGNFVVVWQSSGQDGHAAGLFGQRFNASGLPQGGEFLVNSYTTGNQAGHAVASDASGNFVVVWDSFFWWTDGPIAFGQRFNASGVAQGGEFQVNSYTTGSQLGLAVASDTNGNFVVVWESWLRDGSTYGVFGQRFNSSGVAQGSDFQVNSYTTYHQVSPSVASDASGNFVVVWSSLGQDGSGFGVFGQRFNASGLPQGGEFLVNSYTTGWQWESAVASDASGNFVVVWSSYGQDGSSYGIFGQRFGDLIFGDGFQ